MDKEDTLYLIKYNKKICQIITRNLGKVIVDLSTYILVFGGYVNMENEINTEEIFILDKIQIVIIFVFCGVNLSLPILVTMISPFGYIKYPSDTPLIISS